MAAIDGPHRRKLFLIIQEIGLRTRWAQAAAIYG